MISTMRFGSLLLLLVVVVLVISVQAVTVTTADVDKTLRFREDGTFRIVQFTDLHFGETYEDDANNKIVQRTILEAEKPDLIAMTGDMVTGYFCWELPKCPPGWFESKYKNVTEVQVELGYRWAYTLGNHDDQADIDRDSIVALDQTYPLSLTQHGPSYLHGATNYVLSVYSSTDPSKIAANLWFFDSGDMNCLGVPGYSCVYPDVVAWYIDTSRTFTQNNGGVPVPGFAFMHIPPPEFMIMYNNATTYGNKDEAVCCFSVNTGLVAAFQEMGDVISVHIGHDHNNDYYGLYNGINLAYGRKTGYGNYGPPAGWLHGARVIEIIEAPEAPLGVTFKTWIRQEDGSVVSDQPAHPPPPSGSAQQQEYCCDTVNGVEGKCSRYERAFYNGDKEEMRRLKLYGK